MAIVVEVKKKDGEAKLGDLPKIVVELMEEGKEYMVILTLQEALTLLKQKEQGGC